MQNNLWANVEVVLFETKGNKLDYDVLNCEGVHRAVIWKGIKKGETFNLYCFECKKYGVEWTGDLKESIINFNTPANLRPKILIKH